MLSKDFFRFNIVLICGFLLDFIICIFFIFIFKMGINISILIGFVSASIFNYIANKNYVFKTINQKTLIVISISLLVKESLYLLLETFVPYPEVPRIF